MHPFLLNSLVRDSFIIVLFETSKKVFIESLLGGGVDKKEKSFNPENAMFIVFGIGVADINSI